METSLPTVLLRPGEADRVVAGHPWLYNGSVLRVTQAVEDGALVQVKDHRQRLLGVGIYNSKSKISVRMLGPERVTVDKAFFEERIRAALAVRQKHLPGATSFRVVNAESDFLSGLIVDKYEDVLVMQTSALGMDQRKGMIAEVLQKIFSPRCIVERNDTAFRKFEGLADANGVLMGNLGNIKHESENKKTPLPSPLPARFSRGEGEKEVENIEHRTSNVERRSAGNPLTPDGGEGEETARTSNIEHRMGKSDLVAIKLNGLSFEVDILGGHKTGLYLDQQVNYRLVAEMCKGAQVLDCFSFLGGFGLHAARAGAAHVHMLDQSADAVAAATRNAAANGLAAQCSFETVNVFDWLKAHTAVKPHERVIPRFDVIVLDPPSFTRSRAAVPDAMRGYKEIHLRALKLLKTGGALATFCCSHHVDAVMFEAVILEAAYDARRILRRVATYSQSPDHPIIPAIPETEYLKGFGFEVVR